MRNARTLDFLLRRQMVDVEPAYQTREGILSPEAFVVLLRAGLNIIEKHGSEPANKVTTATVNNILAVIKKAVSKQYRWMLFVLFHACPMVSQIPVIQAKIDEYYEADDDSPTDQKQKQNMLEMKNLITESTYRVPSLLDQAVAKVRAVFE